VAATPAVSGTNVYFPDYAGNLFAVDRTSGTSVWTTKIATATGVANDYSRSAPLLAGGLVILGNQGGRFATPSTPVAQSGAWVLAFDATTGALVRKTQVDSFFSVILTQAAVAFGNTVYVDVSSNEEGFSNKLFNGGIAYKCCSFRGSLVALDLASGAVQWRTYTVPQGYSQVAQGRHIPIHTAPRSSACMRRPPPPHPSDPLPSTPPSGVDWWVVFCRDAAPVPAETEHQYGDSQRTANALSGHQGATLHTPELNRAAVRIDSGERRSAQNTVPLK
jgi:outer membrane protein assembly factor BamB